MKRLSCCLFLTACLGIVSAPAARAQTPEAEVLAVVNGLFDAMRAADSARVQAAFHPEGRLFTFSERNGEPLLREADVAEFAGRVRRAGAGVLDERSWDEEVRIDGPLASAWMPYVFYLAGEFSHCGVDAFQFARTAEGWKILSLAYTARTDACEIPAEIGPD